MGSLRGAHSVLRCVLVLSVAFASAVHDLAPRGVADSTVTVALIVLLGAVLERRHTTKIRRLEDLNTRQHNQGYGLLQSIDGRLADQNDTITTMASDVGGLRQWQVAHDKLHDAHDREVMMERAAVVAAHSLIERAEHKAIQDLDAAATAGAGSVGSNIPYHSTPDPEDANR